MLAARGDGEDDRAARLGGAGVAWVRALAAEEADHGAVVPSAVVPSAVVPSAVARVRRTDSSYGHAVRRRASPVAGARAVYSACGDSACGRRGALAAVLPGVVLVPAMVIAFGRLQERGVSYVFAG